MIQFIFLTKQIQLYSIDQNANVVRFHFYSQKHQGDSMDKWLSVRSIPILHFQTKQQNCYQTLKRISMVRSGQGQYFRRQVFFQFLQYHHNPYFNPCVWYLKITAQLDLQLLPSQLGFNLRVRIELRVSLKASSFELQLKQIFLTFINCQIKSFNTLPINQHPLHIFLFYGQVGKMIQCPSIRDGVQYEILKFILNYIISQPHMAHVQVSKLSGKDLAELACTYAALILHDDGQDITGDKISKLVNASGVKVEAYWPKLFAKALSGHDISSFFNYGGSSGESAPAPAPVADKKQDKGKKEEKKEEKKKEAPPPPPPKEEEEDMDMGDLFG